MKVYTNVNLKDLTTLRIGGKAKQFTLVHTPGDLSRALNHAKNQNLPTYVIGEGSNLVVSDNGFDGIIIKMKIKKFERHKNIVTVGAGENLFSIIKTLNKQGLSGLEKMSGIPGSIGGAVYGSAGAYGQEIKDRILSVRIFDGKNFKNLTRMQCRFGYRDSIFKRKKNWIIVEVKLKLNTGTRGVLKKISRHITAIRKKKYRPGLMCPGSFFKNIKLVDIKNKQRLKKFVNMIEKEKIMYGKVPSGYLLDQVGARGMTIGGISVASHHGNLLYNKYRGQAREIKKLAIKLKTLVQKKFQIELDEEVQYVGFD